MKLLIELYIQKEHLSAAKWLINKKPGLIFNERSNEFQIMNEIQRAKIVKKILNKTYPKIKVPLKSRNVLHFLISVLLSAQCTDVNVNNVTKNIYPKYYKPEHFVK